MYSYHHIAMMISFDASTDILHRILYRMLFYNNNWIRYETNNQIHSVRTQSPLEKQNKSRSQLYIDSCRNTLYGGNTLRNELNGPIKFV